MAPLSDTLRMSGDSGMAPSSRDRLSVDLPGLKGPLFERARIFGVSPSVWVRTTLAEALGQSCEVVGQALVSVPRPHTAGRTRVCLRMTREQVAATLQSARQAGMSPGDFVAALIAGVPAVATGSSRHELLATLSASCSELSTFSRNLHHLMTLLRQGAYRPAEEYRPMLDTLATAVRAHLKLTTRALTDVRPQRGTRTRPPINNGAAGGR